MHDFSTTRGWLVLLLFMVWTPFSVRANVPEKQLRCATTHYPPFTIYHPSTQQFSGSDTDLLRQLAAEMGWHVSIDNLPWSRVNYEIHSGEQYDCFFSLSYKAERAKHLDYTDVPMHTTHYALIKTKGGRQANQVIGSLRGIPLSDELAQRLNIDKFTMHFSTSNEQLLEMLMLNRIDGFVTNSEVGKYLISQAKAEEYLTVDVANELPVPTFLTFRRGRVDTQAVNAALQRLLSATPIATTGATQ